MVLIGCYLYFGCWDWESICDVELVCSVLVVVGLEYMEWCQIYILLGGEWQCLVIVMLFIQVLLLYLFDELFVYFDFNYQMVVFQLFVGVVCDCGVGVIMVLYDLVLVYCFCDYVLLLYGDGCIEMGMVDGILMVEKLFEFYGYGL